MNDTHKKKGYSQVVGIILWNPVEGLVNFMFEICEIVIDGYWFSYQTWKWWMLSVEAKLISIANLWISAGIFHPIKDHSQKN